MVCIWMLFMKAARWRGSDNRLASSWALCSLMLLAVMVAHR